MNRRPWTPEEDAVVLANVGHRKAAATKLGRTWVAIKRRREWLTSTLEQRKARKAIVKSVPQKHSNRPDCITCHGRCRAFCATTYRGQQATRET